MKKYANLPGITHIDAIEQPDQGENRGKPHDMSTQMSHTCN